MLIFTFRHWHVNIQDCFKFLSPHIEWKKQKQTSLRAADFSVMCLFDITASVPCFAKIAEPGCYVAYVFWRKHASASGQDEVKSHSL